MAERPIFFDPTGRRRKRVRLGMVLFALLVILSALALAATIELAPASDSLPIVVSAPVEHALRPPRANAAVRGGRALVNAVDRLFYGPDKAVPRPGAPARPGPSAPLAVGFTVPWDDGSAASLQRNIDALDWIAPVWLTINGADHRLLSIRDTRTKAIINRAQRRPVLVPVLQNAAAGVWDETNTKTLLHDPAARKRMLDLIEPYLVANQANGLTFDLEQLDPQARADYRLLLREARVRFAPHHWIIAVAVPVGAGWETRQFAALADKIFIMAYDEHSEVRDPGPIASRRWWLEQVAAATAGIPRDKVVVTLGNYGYVWYGNQADPQTVEEAWQDAYDSDAKPVFDPVSGNSGFAFDDGGTTHVEWLLDALSAHDQMTMLSRAGLNQIALWRLGSEDPGIWAEFGRGAVRDLSGLNLTLPAGTNVDFEGLGEILKIHSLPSPGRREVTLDKQGLVASANFVSLPRPYVIDRQGYKPGLVALTFDDGPDDRWTQPILDILKQYRVPATFFVVGENAVTHRDLLQRMIAEGHEVGSHTYTHPNLATTGRAQTLFELNATQRLFEAYTGRRLALFRAPYFGDAEPTTADEIGPIVSAQNRGYISVGLHVDAEDWQRPGVRAIIDNVVNGVSQSPPGVVRTESECNLTPELECSHNIVLLHDSGGDRQQTIAALPVIIQALRARGYRFVPVSELAGISRDAAMPVLTASERTTARVDLALFQSVSVIEKSLHFLFAAALTLGILRALALSGLALLAARRELRDKEMGLRPEVEPGARVTVIIPAYNEERVIERSVRTVLASREVEIELIVVDDGSKDRTSAIVADAFGDDPRVRLLTLENGGKAAALNRALALVSSEIVIALDADTVFEDMTIARLARWFRDPALGAVAGNAKVGNRVNLVTKWQALEYITAQNLERRALGQLDAIMVVPGAVGAWRMAAIREVGGYPPDTLAEDQDLTIAIQRAGWKVTYDQSAVAWTEAPQNLRSLAKQRFRWAFGTLQCLWKHRAVMARGRPRGLAFVGMPQAILFQLLFAAVSPVIDLALIANIASTAMSIHEHGYSDVQGNIGRMAAFWLLFGAIDLVAAGIGFALERKERWGLLGWLLPQRFVYRQVMYYVVLKAIVQALRGPRVGWSSIARTGTVTAAR